MLPSWSAIVRPLSSPLNLQKVACSIYTLSHLSTVTSQRIPEKDACHRARNFCVFSRVQKGTLGLSHKGCVLQRVSLGALSDVTVVLGMRQSIVRCWGNKFVCKPHPHEIILSVQAQCKVVEGL